MFTKCPALHFGTANWHRHRTADGDAGYTYVYDDDGNRVAKMAGDTGTLYWYMSPGIVAESDLSGNLKLELRSSLGFARDFAYGLPLSLTPA